MQSVLTQDAAEFQRVLSELVRIYMFRDRDRISSHDVSISGAHALAVLIRLGPIGLGQLATELFVDKSTASRIISGLEEKGYISRTIDPEDRRAVRLEATPAGRALHERIQEDTLRDAAELLRPFATEVRQGMMARLRQMAGTFAVYAGVTDASVSLLPGSGGSIPLGADLRIAGPPDLQEVLALLRSANLSVDGVEEHFLTGFVVARDPESWQLIGVAGVETYGVVGLLRLVAVHPSYRSAGLGGALALAAINRARVRGLRELYLLTTLAENFLRRNGWETIERGELPAALMASRQLRDEEIPSAAVAMRLRLS